MRQFLIILFLLIFLSSLYASADQGLSFYLMADGSSLRTLTTASCYFCGGIGISLAEIGFSLPVTYIADESGGEEQLIDLGLHLHIYPFTTGFFYSISLLEMVIFLGPYIPETRVHTLSEMSFGFEINFFENLSLAPRIRVRNISGTFTEELEYIQGFVPGYTMVDVAVEIRYSVASFERDS